MYLVLLLVQQLRTARVQLGLVSNTDERMGTSDVTPPYPHILSQISHSAATAMTSLGIDSFFPPNLILLSAVEGIEKPDPIIFQRACERAGVPPGEALHVGDDYNR